MSKFRYCWRTSSKPNATYV